MTRTLHDEATAILDRGGLRALLERYGTVVVHGSYALDLMVWRDLDIYVVIPAPLPLEAFFRLGGEIAQLVNAHRMHFRNESGGSDRDLPAGLYWGVYANGWKIDIWAVDAHECARLNEYELSVARELTPQTRDAILQIKSVFHTHEGYRRTFGARDIYDAVLHHHVRDAEGFEAWLRR